MKKFFYFLSLAILSCSKVDNLPNPNLLQIGDLIFQTSLSPQSQAIQLATHSPYSHVGIIYIKFHQFYVLEAIQPVKLTILSEWILRGEGRHYVVKRLKNAELILTPGVVQKMKTLGKNWLGKNYDFYFEWNDKAFYCSELVWKLYQKTTGIELARLQKFKEFDLEHPLSLNRN